MIPLYFGIIGLSWLILLQISLDAANLLISTFLNSIDMILFDPTISNIQTIPILMVYNLLCSIIALALASKFITHKLVEMFHNTTNIGFHDFL